MGKRAFNEKRLFDRTLCSMPGSYVLKDISSGTFVCKDISPKGIGIQTTQPLPVDTKVKIEITTKKKVPLILEGKVRWSRKEGDGYRVGIEFNEPLFILLSMLV
ncbi:MAG: PilZ domain-containing protein [Candidatus Omnitrophica bacterium]|jgi:hypothetical protein|nr:PilZ domain-containing protein [Candidatus Omnitrophota bacterium]